MIQLGLFDARTESTALTLEKQTPAHRIRLAQSCAVSSYSDGGYGKVYVFADRSWLRLYTNGTIATEGTND